MSLGPKKGKVETRKERVGSSTKRDTSRVGKSCLNRPLGRGGTGSRLKGPRPECLKESRDSSGPTTVVKRNGCMKRGPERK